MTHSWLNTGMQNRRYRRLTEKLNADFPLCGGSEFVTPVLFKGQLELV